MLDGQSSKGCWRHHSQWALSSHDLNQEKVRSVTEGIIECCIHFVGLLGEALIAGGIFRSVALFQNKVAVVDAKLDRQMDELNLGGPLPCMWGRAKGRQSASTPVPKPLQNGETHESRRR